MREAADGGAEAILGPSAEALRYFEVFLPRYREWTGKVPAGADYHSLAELYEQQHGMDIETIRAFAAALRDELDSRINDEAGVQVARVRELATSWNGSPAAAHAQQFLAGVETRVSTGLDTLWSIHTTAATTADRLEDALRHKAERSKTEFSADTAAGRTPQQIDWIIDCANEPTGATTESARNQLRTILPEHSSGNTDPHSVCRDWLDQVFIPEIDSKVAAFTTLCTDTHTTVVDAYNHLINTLDDLDSGYISPGGHPSPTFDLAYTSHTPQYLSAGSTSTASTEPETQAAPIAGRDLDQTLPEPPATPEDTYPSDTQPSSTLTDTPTSAPEPTDPLYTEADTPASPTPGSPTTAEPSAPPPDVPGYPDTSAPGEWTPSDITNMVTAISQITGTIPDLITSVGGLVDNLDEIITATGEATSSVISAIGESTAAVIDATDNQPDTPPLSTDSTDNQPGMSPPTDTEATDTEDVNIDHTENGDITTEAQPHTAPTPATTPSTPDTTPDPAAIQPTPLIATAFGASAKNSDHTHQPLDLPPPQLQHQI
ncbi:hypothetical protein ACL02S_17290 [Nocardia sp. 004]|uniref:hypothetical protein n=1 Tax=Nocardia sp. 004 TaxID=3385978 RepID=UPI0039A04130